jgi:hypothetical protein
MKTKPQITEDQEDKREKAKALIITLLGAIYAISPLDIIPDIPVIGWIDDFFVVSAALVNLMEHFTGRTHYTLRRGLKYTKWALVIIGSVVVIILLVLGYFIFDWIYDYYNSTQV